MELSKKSQTGRYSKEAKKSRAKNFVKKLPKKIKEATVWANFSKSVRLEAVTLVIGHEGLGECYTCGKTIPIKEADAGHCISRRKKATKYDRRNVKLQCKKCNKWLNGNTVEFIRKMGVETYAQLLTLSLSTKKIDQEFLHKINDESKEIINKICKERGINKW